MIQHHLQEYGTLTPVQLTQQQAAGLAASRAVEVVPAGPRGLWTLRAGSYVGVLQVAGVEVWIRPKLPVGRLLYLLGFSTDPDAWESESEPDFGDAPELVPGMAVAFAHHAHQALQQGLLQGYRATQESAAVVRGRLMVREQLRRRPGAVVPLEIVYDDFSADILENRILLAATRRLLCLPGLPDPIRRRLRHLSARLADVSPLQAFPPRKVAITRLNRRYRHALALADLVLSGRSLEVKVGNVRATGFVVELYRVFENYLTTLLAQELPRLDGGGHLRRQHVDQLDDRGLVPIKPDVTWWRGSRCVMVADAKYKALTGLSSPNPDLYQVLAYCSALGLPRGHLVYAAGGGQHPAEHTVRRVGTSILVHTLALHRPLPELKADGRRLAARLLAST